MRLTAQLINGTSRVLQKLLKYFNDTIILIIFIAIIRSFSCYFFLDLYDSESAKLSITSSL